MDEPLRISQTAQRLEAARALVLELEAKANKEAAGSTAPLEARALAVRLHKGACDLDHASLDCAWHVTPDADDVKLADWSDPTHAFWLRVAGVALEAPPKE